MMPSYRNQSTDLLCKSIDCFLYEGNTGTWWVNPIGHSTINCPLSSPYEMPSATESSLYSSRWTKKWLHELYSYFFQLYFVHSNNLMNLLICSVNPNDKCSLLLVFVSHSATSHSSSLQGESHPQTMLIFIFLAFDPNPADFRTVSSGVWTSKAPKMFATP